jgi:hypothetical protein
VISTPKNNEEVKKPDQYMFRRPISSGSNNPSNKEVKSEMREPEISKPGHISSRVQRNNSVDSIQKRVDRSIERVNSGKYIIPTENYNHQNINSSKGNVI